MQRDNQKERSILCKYDPIEVFIFNIKFKTIILTSCFYDFAFLKGGRVSNKCKMGRRACTRFAI